MTKRRVINPQTTRDWKKLRLGGSWYSLTRAGCVDISWRSTLYRRRGKSKEQLKPKMFLYSSRGPSQTILTNGPRTFFGPGDFERRNDASA